ncbi:MAG: glycoside hydrolase family 97 N-terminal domain-containing protein, partial [Candidatus Marinimicrobia bacterium]|nr:glycoside hydrolase family 97 N-terminal domain-containing protein [Candidatus Neomarinimicrobiota bacterium]
MKLISKQWLGIILITAVLFTGCKNDRSQLTLLSPDGNVQLALTLDAAHKPQYSVVFNKQVILSESALSLELKSGYFTEGFVITKVKRTSINNIYDLVVGKTSRARNHYNQIEIDLKGITSAGKLGLVFRAYDDGVAFRYLIPEQSTIDSFKIISENSEFRFTENYRCWVLELENFNT